MFKIYSIDSKIRLGNHLGSFSQTDIKNEPMFFSASPEFAYKEGGKITVDFLEAFFDDNPDINRDSLCFDSRVHMLMPGMWPCIPGWHHDDVPRSRADKQPNYDNPEWKGDYCLALHNGDIAPTEFAIGTCELRDTGKVPLYSDWHEQVEKHIAHGYLERQSAVTGRLIYFNHDTLHQGTRALTTGFRWFGRMSWNVGYDTHGRIRHNEIRRQANVYLDNPHVGW